MKFLIADDHALFREGVRQILNQLEECEYILEAANYQETLHISRESPDLSLILLDLNMPGMNGFSSLDAIAEQTPTAPLVVLSGSEDPVDMQQSLDAGALGYIPKTESPAVILNAIRLVLSGGIYIPTVLLQHQSHIANTSGSKSSVDLTPRQQEVLFMVTQGKSNKSIARDMDLSEATIKVHVTAILKALNVSNRTEAAMVAKQMALV